MPAPPLFIGKSLKEEAYESIANSLRVKNLLELTKELHNLNFIDDEKYIKYITELSKIEGLY